MLPFLNMRLYRGNNMNLSKYIEKLKNKQLTIENILEEDEIIQDLKLNTNSQFISILSNEVIRKLMDYATKMPSMDDQKIGHKYPFNATEILIADNSAIQERIMNEIIYKASDFYKGEIENEDNKEEEKKEGREEKQGENNIDKKTEGNLEMRNKNKEIESMSKFNNVINKDKESQKNEIKEASIEESQNFTEINMEEKKEKIKTQDKREELKSEDKNKEIKCENKKEEMKNEDKKEEINNENRKDEIKNEDIKHIKEQNGDTEGKIEEIKCEENKKDTYIGNKKKLDEIKKNYQKEEKNGETEEILEEPKPEKLIREEINLEVELEKEEEYNDGEKGQRKHSPRDNEEEEDNQKENEEKEESKKEDTKNVKIYDNIDYFFQFLQQPKETISNHVLVGYFYRIFNHLIISQSIKIVQYIFDYPYKSKFDILDVIVKNLNRKSMGAIVNKLLLFFDDTIDLKEKKILLIEKMLEELGNSIEKDKYECISDVLASSLNNKNIYIIFMGSEKLVDLLFSLADYSKDIPKKIICIINLFIKVNENILKNLSSHCTKNLIQENPLDFMNLLNNYETIYNLDDKKVNKEEIDEINKKVLLSLFTALKKTEFKLLEDFGIYSKINEEFLATYQQKQKKIGMKKLSQIELLRTILDIFVNSCNSQLYEKEIEELINILKNKNIFYYCHKLFFDFPFSNIYHTFYNQIIDIVINQKSPVCLIEYFFKYSDVKENKNLVTDLLEHFSKNMKFTFNSSNISFNPCISYEITLLNKINNSNNDTVKKLFKKDNNLKVFYEVLGEQINHIFNQKLLLSDTLENLRTDDEKPFPMFGKANFFEIIEEDISIYNIYKEGGDYIKKLNEKIEREKLEREKEEQEYVGEEEENKDEHINIDESEENEEGVEELGVDREEGGEEGEEREDINIVAEEVEQKEEDDRVKDILDEENESSDDKKTESSEENSQDKQYNDVNYWNPRLNPTDDIMNELLKDIE